MVLNCNTSVDYHFVTDNDVTIKGSVVLQCTCVDVKLFNSVCHRHSIVLLIT